MGKKKESNRKKTVEGSGDTCHNNTQLACGRDQDSQRVREMKEAISTRHRTSGSIYTSVQGDAKDQINANVQVVKCENAPFIVPNLTYHPSYPLIARATALRQLTIYRNQSVWNVADG